MEPHLDSGIEQFVRQILTSAIVDPLAIREYHELNVKEASSGGIRYHEYPASTKRFNLQHVQVYDQKTRSLCGFHALYNFKYFTRYLASVDNPKLQEISARKLNDGSKFWRFYSRALKRVLMWKDLSNWEKEDLKKLGPLDPSHTQVLTPEMMSSLKEQFPKFQIDLEFFYYGFGVLQTSHEELDSLESKLRLLREEKSNRILGIVLGVTNHWTLLVGHRTVDLEAPIFYFLDSRNVKLLNLNTQDIPKGVDEYNVRRIEFGLKSLDPSRRNLYIRSFLDLHKTYEILDQVSRRCLSFLGYVVKREAIETLRSFKEWTIDRQQGHSVSTEDQLAETDLAMMKRLTNEIETQIAQGSLPSDEWHLLVYNWAEKELRPQCIRNDLYSVMIKLEDISEKETEELKLLYRWATLTLGSMNWSADVLSQLDSQGILPKLTELLNDIVTFLEQ